tara:strand:- start:2935 stop:4305 length:1371 start_codon:yes stop_codon:yes gene_type:complete
MDRINRSGTGIASLGRDEDQFLAHVALGERVVPPVISAATQARINQEMRAAGLDPNEYAVGSGMSINPITGLPEFGFFKKAFKSIKKVAKPIAQVAQFIPGPWQAPAALIAKTSTVVDVARGKASPLQLLTLGKGGGGLESLTGGKGNILSNIFKGTPGINPSAGGGLGDLLGRAKEFILPGADKKGLFKNVLGGIGSLVGGMGAGQQDEYTPIMDQNGNVIGYRNENTMQDISLDQYNQMMSSKPQFSGLFGPDSVADKLFNVDPNKGTGPLSFLGKGAQQGADFLGGLGGGGFGGGLASAGLGGFLGKLAYDAAKDRAGGLAVTPQVSMDALGRYQLASDLGTGGTRGEFGLAPKPAVLDVAGMGRQPFAEGGIAELDLREGGESIGPGTGTSDDIPAMLSDGEFVMTAAATKGAGAFDLKKGKSGIELISGGSSSREKGVENMRELMNIFEAV